MMLLNQMQTGEPLRAMAGGGFPNAGEPVIVGEQGPEVFVPDVPGAIVPRALAPHPLISDLGYYNVPDPGRGGPWKWEYGMTFPDTAAHDPRLGAGSADHLANLVKADPWDAWLESRPESGNVEDRRTPEQRALDNELLFQHNRNVPKPPVSTYRKHYK